MSHLRELFVLFLASCLLYSPMFAVSATSNRAKAPTPKTATVQAITHRHKPQELLVKFRPGAPKANRDVVLNAFAKNSKKLKGRSGVERFTIKDNLDLATTLFNVRQLNMVVEWVEPNYIVTKSTQSVF